MDRGNFFYITTALQLPKNFRQLDIPSLLSSYIDAYYKVAGENCFLDRKRFTEYLVHNLSLLMPAFNQDLLIFRNASFKQDLSKVMCLSAIPLGRNIPDISKQLASAFCEAFIELPEVFGSGIVFVTL